MYDMMSATFKAKENEKILGNKLIKLVEFNVNYY